MEGRTALVTGGGRGIGRETALLFAREGAAVAVADRHADVADEVAAAIEDAGARATAIAADVSDEEAVRRMVDEATERLGPLDAVVHSAGIGFAAPVTELTLGAWREMIDVNLTGAFLVTRAVLPAMLERERGRIVVVSSQLGFCGAAGLSHYCAAKAGLHGFVKSVAREVAGRGVTINALAPGPTITPLMDTLPPEMAEAIRREVPLGRFAEVHEIAPSALLLASDEGSYYTGAVLNPSGGHVMP